MNEVTNAQNILPSITDYNGKVWCQAHVDTYNRYTQRYNECTGTGALSDAERDLLLDNRHKFFVAITNLNEGK